MKPFTFKAEIVDDPHHGPKLEVRASWERPFPLEDRALALDYILETRFKSEQMSRVEVAQQLMEFANALARS